MGMSSKVLDNFGIISAFFKSTGLLKELDRVIPKSREHKISHGEAILAMVMNMLKVGSTRLWKFPEFFAKLPVNRLFGSEICAEDINEYAIGETLDCISSHDESKLFSDIVRYMSRHCSIDTSVLHADTTNFSLTGLYEGKRIPPNEPVFCTFGPAKDQRTDLKRYVLNMMVTSQGIPVLMKSLAGNTADVKSIAAGMKEFEESLRKEIDTDMASPKKSCYVADAAFYSAENIRAFPAECHWLTRVPAKLTEAKELLQKNVEMSQCADDPRYSFFETASDYGDVKQKWVLVKSACMEAKTQATEKRHAQKQLEEAQKQGRAISRRSFACEEDARREADNWIKSYPLCRISSLDVSEELHGAAGKRGRPAKDEQLEKSYRLNLTVELSEQACKEQEQTCGLFILATNDTAMTARDMLKTYKDQQSVERGFRFLKDKTFLVSEVYLKKPSRIRSLSFVMVLSYLVYAILEQKLRRQLAEKNITIPTPAGKPDPAPTLKRIFEFFDGIAEVTVAINGQTAIEITNITKLLASILDIWGEEYAAIYR